MLGPLGKRGDMKLDESIREILPPGLVCFSEGSMELEPAVSLAKLGNTIRLEVATRINSKSRTSTVSFSARGSLRHHLRRKSVHFGLPACARVSRQRPWKSRDLLMPDLYLPASRQQTVT